MDRDVNPSSCVARENKTSAPALEKGLELLEVLAAEAVGLTQKQLAVRVGRSVSEIFRMLGVLQQRGYIHRNDKTGEYALTLRLFHLAMQHPPTRRLQQSALPVLEALAASTGLGCHLSMISGRQFLIIAQADPPYPMGWTVKLGAAFPFSIEYVSARVLAAFQDGARRDEMVRILTPEGRDQAEIAMQLDMIRHDGYDMRRSAFVAGGLTDLACPVLDERGAAAAALNLPFVPGMGQPACPEDALPLLRAAAAEISAAIGGSIGNG
jgi:DNA-binding IclR family transcriptional regulator